MPAPILIDLTHSSHTRARTGIQRVARSLYRELGSNADPVCMDPFEETWRSLEKWELANLAASGAAAGRGSHWPIAARVRGRLRRWVARPKALYLRNKAAGLLVPEIFSPDVAVALPKLFAVCKGPRVALFHDALPMQYPELAPKSTVARFPSYLAELLAFDGVAAVSEDSRRALSDYWRWLGATKTPALEAIPLGIDPAPKAPAPSRQSGHSTVLCVGSLEARKNHLALLEAYDRLWSQGARFNLELVGLANRETGASARAMVEKLRSAGRLVRYRGPLGDDELEKAYQRCVFTVYPSIAEGFGLPVAESLVRGKPCLCRMTGALGEVARGGGCVDLGSASPGEIAAAIRKLLESSAERDALEAGARGRRFKTWKDYTGELSAWMRTLRRDA